MVPCVAKYQQIWYWLYRMNWSLYSKLKINWLCHIGVEKYVMFPKMNLVTQRSIKVNLGIYSWYLKKTWRTGRNNLGRIFRLIVHAISNQYYMYVTLKLCVCVKTSQVLPYPQPQGQKAGHKDQHEAMINPSTVTSRPGLERVYHVHGCPDIAGQAHGAH